MKISMVIPCYNSELTIIEVVKQISKIYEDIGCDYEIILVNDNSKDRTWETIEELALNDSYVKGINLSKNYGQHAAVMAGLRASSGDLVMSSDDDGQTPIEHIPEMIKLIDDGEYDCVCAKYIDFEKKSIFRRMGTILYKKLVYWLIDCPPEIEVRIFMVARRYVIDEICKFTQPYPIFNGLLLRATNRIGNIEMQQHSRKHGKSGYSFRKLVHTFVNGFVAFSIKPLRLSAILGGMSSCFGFVFGLVIIAKKILNPQMQAGWSSIMAVLLLMSGLVLMVLGMIGEYLGRAYMSITNLPQYVVKNTVNIEKQ